MPRPETAPPELWRREIFDGRDGPPRAAGFDTGLSSSDGLGRLVSSGFAAGGLLSDYAFGTMGETLGDGDSRMPSRMTNRGGTPWTEITTMSSVQRAKTPGFAPTIGTPGPIASSGSGGSSLPYTGYRPMGSPLLKTTTPKRHHSHGLRHECGRGSCASKKGLYGDPVSMLPVPKARIPGAREGAKGGGATDQVLPHVNLLKGKTYRGKSQHRLYQIHGVTPKPTSPRESPRSSCLTQMESFEHTLKSFQINVP